MNLKAPLRHLIRQRKQLFTIDERESQSYEIMRLLEDHPVFQKAHVVLLYAALPDEVQTAKILERWGTEKQLLLPVVTGDSLEMRRFTGIETLQQGSYGIPEPLTGQLFTAYATIDLAVIPGMAFTQDGKRLGRGKGYYDRLLSNPTFEKVYKIGLAFSYQLLPEIPTSSHDVILNEVLTVSSVI